MRCPAHFPFRHCAVGHQGLDNHAHLLVFGAPIGEVGFFYVEGEVVSAFRARHLAWWMHVQRVVLDVDVRAALFLHLLQHIVARGVVDDELGVGPCVGTIDLIVLAHTLYYMG